MRDYEFSTDTLQEYADPGCEYADPGCEMQPAQPLYRPAAPEETRKRKLYLKKLRLLRSSLLSLAVLMLLSAAAIPQIQLTLPRLPTGTDLVQQTPTPTQAPTPTAAPAQQPTAAPTQQQPTPVPTPAEPMPPPEDADLYIEPPQVQGAFVVTGQSEYGYANQLCVLFPVEIRPQQDGTTENPWRSGGYVYTADLGAAELLRAPIASWSQYTQRETRRAAAAEPDNPAYDECRFLYNHMALAYLYPTAAGAGSDIPSICCADIGAVKTTADGQPPQSEDVIRHAYYAVCFNLSDKKLQELKDEELTLAIEYPDYGKYSTVTYTYVLSELPQTDWQTMNLLMTGNAPDADRAAYEQAIAEYLP